MNLQETLRVPKFVDVPWKLNTVAEESLLPELPPRRLPELLWQAVRRWVDSLQLHHVLMYGLYGLWDLCPTVSWVYGIYRIYGMLMDVELMF